MVATLARERRSDTPGVGWYEPLEWVLVRSPLLPVERYAELWSGTDSEAGLPQAVRDPVVRRAIAVASPSLFERLGRPPSSPSALRRWRLAVLRYLIRMSTRPTPYGLNAAVSLAGWGAKTDLELGSGEVVRARLDMGLLDALIRLPAGVLDRRTGSFLDLLANSLGFEPGAILALPPQALGLVSQPLLRVRARLLLGLAASLIGRHPHQPLGLLVCPLEPLLGVALQLLRLTQTRLGFPLHPLLLFGHLLTARLHQTLDLLARRRGVVGALH